MLVFGHVASATVSWHVLDRRADLRLILLFTLVADIIDKPLGLWLFRETINNGRVWFHSLAVNLLLSAVLLLAKQNLMLVLALWLHQLCDRMWMRPWVALWPFTGRFGYRDLPLDDWVYGLFNVYNVTTELIGIAVVVFFAWRYRLFQDSRLWKWVRTGELSRPDPLSPPG